MRRSYYGAKLNHQRPLNAFSEISSFYDKDDVRGHAIAAKFLKCCSREIALAFIPYCVMGYRVERIEHEITLPFGPPSTLSRCFI